MFLFVEDRPVSLLRLAAQRHALQPPRSERSERSGRLEARVGRLPLAYGVFLITSGRYTRILTRMVKVCSECSPL